MIIRYYTFAPYYTLLSFLLSHYYLLLSHYYKLLFYHYLPITLPIIRYYTFPHYYTLLSLLLYAIIRNANYYLNYLIFLTVIFLVYFSWIEGSGDEKWLFIMYETYLSFGISRNANCMDWSEPKYLTWDYYAHYSNYYTHYLEVLIWKKWWYTNRIAMYCDYICNAKLWDQE